MITFQDWLQVPKTDKEISEFVRRVISAHKDSDLYKTAKIADEYDKCRNTTVMNYQKMVTLVTGQQVIDRYATVHRSTSNFFNVFTTQLNQYLLGNGVHWSDDGKPAKGKNHRGKYDDKLGADFDLKLQKLGKFALCGGVAFGFYNLNRLTVFSVLEFAPIYDEETGALVAGVRFWQIDETKPLRATFYEADGCTDYMWTKEAAEGWVKIDDGCFMRPKTRYTWITVGDAKDRAEGTEEIVDGAPLAGFPIVPMYGNPHRQSELVGKREKIDAYDFILNGFEDDLDNAQLYWMITGAGGMDDPDLQKFLDRLKTTKAVAPGDDQSVAPVQVEIPYAAREALLDRLNKQLYRDSMIMNPEDIASGATTATQIRAAYERQNVKADQYEYCVLEFMQELMRLAGIDDEPTFTRSTIVNVQEEVQTVVQAAQYLSEDYVTEKVLSLLGDGDKAEEMIANRDADELEQINYGNTNQEVNEDEERT